jgi:hypothetical protein
VTTHTVPRAERGIGALTIAVDGHWNSSIAGNVGSAAPRRRTYQRIRRRFSRARDFTFSPSGDRGFESAFLQ